ncbi:hypothetical protein [Lysinibacillus sp. G4S2]|uniref:hypothetical protein n=1 Tax=Lysinibacillus sp. G4S2 TaxID=3055859 RepID=UPI0025A0D913|nr:hypothetical protein [Lysinibacillus sp. G4S2]MDM5250715.1 hypothetical protein [Lysinibacillus sp. G4S2]
MRPWSVADVFCSESKAAATNVFCAKAKRQQQSAQSERKSPPRFAEEPYFINLAPFNII